MLLSLPDIKDLLRGMTETFEIKILGERFEEIVFQDGTGHKVRKRRETSAAQKLSWTSELSNFLT